MSKVVSFMAYMRRTKSKFFVRYDNEWGYSYRVADLVKFLSDKGL